MSAQSESTRASKQAYLAAEILSEGFDPAEFESYCEPQKGSDIDLWTFEELIECVQAFKSSHTPKIRPIQRANTDIPSTTSSDLREDSYHLPTKQMLLTPLSSENKAQSVVTQY